MTSGAIGVSGHQAPVGLGLPSAPTAPAPLPVQDLPPPSGLPTTRGLVVPPQHSVCMPPPGVAAPRADSGVAPLPPGDRLWSRGDRLHAHGLCIPCQFMRSRRGCLDGADCLRCHHPHEEMTHSAIRRAHRRHSAQQAKKLAEATPDTTTASEGTEEQIACAAKLHASSEHISPKLGDRRSSHGDLLHAQGLCMPCQFMRSRRGCLDGADCIHCHYPHEEMTHGAIKRLHRLRPAQRARKLAVATPDTTTASEGREVSSEPATMSDQDLCEWNGISGLDTLDAPSPGDDTSQIHNAIVWARPRLSVTLLSTDAVYRV